MFVIFKINNTCSKYIQNTCSKYIQNTCYKYIQNSKYLTLYKCFKRFFFGFNKTKLDYDWKKALSIACRPRAI